MGHTAHPSGTPPTLCGNRRIFVPIISGLRKEAYVYRLVNFDVFFALGTDLAKGVLPSTANQPRLRKQEGDSRMRKLLSKDTGQSLVEYAPIIALAAVILVSGLTTLHGGTSTAFTAVVALL